jgi:hypothetical protein
MTGMGQNPSPRDVRGDGGTCPDTGRQRVRSPIARTDASIRIAFPSMTPGPPLAPAAVSALHAKNDVHDALHFTEPFRVQFVGRLDVFVVGSGDLECEACGCEFD